MLGRLLLWMVRGATRRPRTVLTVCTLLSLGLGAWGLVAPRDLSFTGILEKSDPLFQRYQAKTALCGTGRRLPVLLEGPDDQLDAAADALARVLRTNPLVQEAFATFPVTYLADRAPLWVNDAVFDDWLALATKPDDDVSRTRLVDALTAMQAQQRVVPGSRLVMVILAMEPLEVDAGGLPFLEMERQAQAALPPGVKARFTGALAVSSQDQARTFARVQFLTPLSLIIVLLLLRFAEQGFRRVIAVGVVMVMTAAMTIGILGLVMRTLTMMETFFGVMVFGLGIDFALHLIARRREEQARGLTDVEALEVAVARAGPGIVTGGLTTAGAFAIIALAPEEAALHLGMSGAVGLMVCLVLMFTALPALWSLIPHQTDKAPNLEIPGVAFLATRAEAWPRATLGIFSGVLLVALLGTSRFHFETDLLKVFNRQVPAIQTAFDLQERYGVNPSPWLVVAADLDDAATKVTRARTLDFVSRIDSATDILRPDTETRRARITASLADITAQREVYLGLVPLVTDDEAKGLTAMAALLDTLAHSATLPHDLASLPPLLRLTLFATDGRPIVAIYDNARTLDGTVARQMRLALEQTVDADVVGFAMLIEATVSPSRAYVPFVALAILVFVVVLLVLDLRRLRLVILAMVPVGFGTVVGFGILCWADIAFSVLTVLIVPLLIGLGVDDGIHVAHRLREHPGQPARAATSVGRAIVMTTLTTCASFAVLLWADHPGLESVATVILVGLPLCLMASICLIPALDRVLPGRPAPDAR